MLRQEIAFFDHKKNSTGALTTRLATDASLVQGVSHMIPQHVYLRIPALQIPGFVLIKKWEDFYLNCLFYFPEYPDFLSFIYVFVLTFIKRIPILTPIKLSYKTTVDVFNKYKNLLMNFEF